MGIKQRSQEYRLIQSQMIGPYIARFKAIKAEVLYTRVNLISQRKKIQHEKIADCQTVALKLHL